jgi:poly(A) polymerase
MNPLPPFIPPAAEAYLVGGCVRDLLLARAPTDYDVAVDGSPADYATRVAAALGGRVVEIGKPGLRTWRVVAADRIVDISAVQGAGIRADLLRRDFSINAIAVATVNGAVLDVAGGREDLARQTIRMVSDAAFRNDPVRLIRAFRFAAQLGFAIESATRDAVRRDAGLIARSAGERIRDEFFKLMGADHHAPAVAGMADTGLLTAVFPELARVPASLPRTVMALREVAALPGSLGRLPDLAARRRMLLRCGVVLHALGSSGAQPEREAVFARLHCAKRDRDHLERLLSLQPIPMRLFEAAPTSDPLSEIRFFLAAEETTPDLLLQEAAWALSDPSAPAAHAAAFAEFAGHVLRRYLEEYLPRKAVPSPITGEDLMAEFGLRPSPVIKELLGRVEEERLMRQPFSRADALRLVGRALAQKANSPPRRGGEF